MLDLYDSFKQSSIPLLLLVLFFISDDDFTDTSFISYQHSKEISISASPQVYVVLAADFDSPTSIANYGVLTPLTAFIWHRIFNVTPIVMLGTREPGRITTVTEAAIARLIRRAGGRIHCISTRDSTENGSGVALPSNLVGAKLMTALQVSRIASIALWYLKDDDIIITSDADIWPLSKKFWYKHLTNLLDPLNEELFIYNGPFFHGQQQIKDCNFVALTSIAAKTRIWRETLSVWFDSLQYAPSPRESFCVYPNTKDNIPMPILPWYYETEKNLYVGNISGGYDVNLNSLLFSDLLKFFLEQGQHFFGQSVWEKEIWYNGASYKLRRIWDYDQVLVAEMIIAANSSLNVNNDLRRLDKFGTRDKESDYLAVVSGKSVEDFTDTHLDSIEDKTWWRLQSIWSFVFDETTSHSLLSESQAFLRDVRSLFDGLHGTDDDKIRGTLFFQDDVDQQEWMGPCDNV